MKNLKSPFTLLFMAMVVACLHVSAWGQSADEKNKLAAISGRGSSVRWEVSAPNSGVTLTISAPDGQVFRKEFKAGISPEFMLSNKDGKLPDGVYTYELRLAPVLSSETKEALAAARSKGNEAEVGRELRQRGALPAHPLVESGNFAILNGSVIVAGALEEGGVRAVGSSIRQPRLPSATTGAAFSRLQQHHARLLAMPDFVIADDLIVQGSACVGLDCVDGEVFGFDTIRMKENNTRLHYDDTSTSAGFPTNNWQIRANSSASGGGSFLAFVDQGATGNSESGTIVFEVDAGAPANSLRVSSTGNVGIGTATPVLDVHANTSDTPAIRLEQNNSGGFTAQTWDIGANEANFFIRDVTSGSRLSLRIRPGAPTSSIDIAANGDVGVGVASPQRALDVVRTGADANDNQAAIQVRTSGTTAGFGPGYYIDNTSQPSGRLWSVFSNGASDGVGAVGTFNIFDGTAGAARLSILSSGNVGIGTTAPTQLLSVNGTAGKPGGGSWDIFSDERLKNIKGRFNTGLRAVMQLQPLRYEYKPNNALGIKSEGEHVGFRAQSLKQIIPEAVSSTDNGYLMVNNDPIIWTMLNAIKEQQKEIEQLKTEVRRLRATSRKRK
ncbi:MAG TPA: tail fiber domain-containing protein [Pyrinomonadaceae bacterium]|nr:tail fiber domain-containing protein [Pyrinomonadaceae bacterium]